MSTRRSDPGAPGQEMRRLTPNAYRRRYRLRTPGAGRNYIQITLPYEVVEREARVRGLSIEEFTRQFRAVAHYNDGFDGVYYTFESVLPGLAQSSRAWQI